MAAQVVRYHAWLLKTPSLEIREIAGAETKDGLRLVKIRRGSRTLMIENIPPGASYTKDHFKIVLGSLVLPGDQAELSFKITAYFKNGLAYSGSLIIDREGEATNRCNSPPSPRSSATWWP